MDARSARCRRSDIVVLGDSTGEQRDTEGRIARGRATRTFESYGVGEAAAGPDPGRSRGRQRPDGDQRLGVNNGRATYGGTRSRRSAARRTSPRRRRRSTCRAVRRAGDPLDYGAELDAASRPRRPVSGGQLTGTNPARNVFKVSAATFASAGRDLHPGAVRLDDADQRHRASDVANGSMYEIVPAGTARSTCTRATRTRTRTGGAAARDAVELPEGDALALPPGMAWQGSILAPARGDDRRTEDQRRRSRRDV